MQSASLAQQSSARRALTTTQVESLVKLDLNSCANQTTTGRIETARINPSRVVPNVNRRAIPASRVARTLHGIWRGQVRGDYGDVKVDYFWIIDTTLGESLLIAQRSGKETLAASPILANAPKLSYLMCAHDGYSPGTNAPQIHEFTKVSRTTDGAARVVEAATGIRPAAARPTPTQMWKQLVEAKYFDSLPYVAFAGALFKPMRIETVPSRTGGPVETFVGWDAEYRGGGSTRLKYVTGVPTIGTERVQFIAAAARSGEYLVASAGNGSLWKVEGWPANAMRPKGGTSGEISSGMMVDGVDYSAYYDLSFDQVSLGPIE